MSSLCTVDLFPSFTVSFVAFNSILHRSQSDWTLSEPFKENRAGRMLSYNRTEKLKRWKRARFSRCWGHRDKGTERQPTRSVEVSRRIAVAFWLCAILCFSSYILLGSAVWLTKPLRLLLSKMFCTTFYPQPTRDFCLGPEANRISENRRESKGLV